MSKSRARECDESWQSLVVDAENAGFWRGLARVWNRANSLFYFNPHFHSVRFWTILKKWTATPLCSGTWEKLRIFLGRAARLTSCIVTLVLLRKNWYHPCFFFTEPTYCANSCIRGVFFLKMCPFFYCVVKGSTVYFSVGAFLSCAVKEVEPCTSLGRNCETDSAYTWRGNPAHSEHPCLIPRAPTRIRIFCVVELAGSESDSSSSSIIIKKKWWNQRHTYIHTYSHFSFSPDSQKVLSSEHNLFLQDIMSITGFIF